MTTFLQLPTTPEALRRAQALCTPTSSIDILVTPGLRNAAQALMQLHDLFAIPEPGVLGACSYLSTKNINIDMVVYTPSQLVAVASQLQHVAPTINMACTFDNEFNFMAPLYLT